MIIFGTRSTAILLAMINFVCGNCHNPAAQKVIKHVTKFTLFFVPLFPVYIKRSVTCTYCGATAPLTKEQADGYVEFVENAQLESQLDAEFGTETREPKA